MNRYIAFYRGINVSGRHKIAMDELKAGFETLGFEGVKPYLNSGNVAFTSDREDAETIARQLEQMTRETFGFYTPVFVILKAALEDVLLHAPDWWGNGNPEIYDNLIFMIRPTTFREVFCEIGAPKEGLEQIMNYRETIFWSFSRKEYQKTNWWSKTASANVRDQLTIRTARTVRKMCEL